jgi:NADH:ubiquinone oxidoreductase subunit C
MSRSHLAQLAGKHNAKMLDASANEACLTVDRTHWHQFMASIFNEDALGPCRLRMLTAKKSRFGIMVIADLIFENDGFRFRVNCEVSIADVLPSLRDLWPYADWFEQEMYEFFDVQTDGINREQRLFLKN